MSFWNMFRTPYLDEDNGANLGGGGIPTDTTGQQTTTQTPDTTGQTGQQQTATEPFLKVKYNHEEMALDRDKAVEFAQKGLNYDRIYPEYEKLRNNPTLSYLEQKAQKLGITVEQLIENDRKFEEQEQLNQLVQQNIPEEYARKLMEHDKFMEEYQTEKQTREQRESEQKMYSDFLDAYPDVKPEDIPVEVWKEHKAGRNLTDAYIRYENKQLRGKLNGVQQQQQTQQANEKNAAASTGSAKATGKATQGYISKEVFEQNRHNQKWMDTNYDNVVSSMNKWGK